MPLEPVLEPAAQEFADATAEPPFLYELPVEEGRAQFDEVQSGDIAKPSVEIEDRVVDGGPSGQIPIRIVRPRAAAARCR